MKVQEFNKYKEHGAYHWKEMTAGMKRYNAGLAARYHISEDIITRNCNIPSVIIDIGCGDRFFTWRLAKLYKNSIVIGFDIDETAIRLANEKTSKLAVPNLSFFHIDAFEFINNSDLIVDLIVATDVIEHLYDRNDFMSKCFDALNNDGYLFISKPVRYKEFPDDKYHIYEFFPLELETFSKSFGFSVIEHKFSHDYRYIEKYNKKIKIMGIGKMRLYKYIYNIADKYFGKNVFKQQNCKLPTMQYILLKKC